MRKEIMDLRSELGQYDWLSQKLIDERKNSRGIISQAESVYDGRPELMTTRQLKLLELDYLESGVNYLNDIIERIRELCGNDAVDTIVRIYCHKDGVENVARDMGFSRRALEMKLSFWLAHIIENQKIDESVETPWTFDSKMFYEKCRIEEGL